MMKEDLKPYLIRNLVLLLLALFCFFSYMTIKVFSEPVKDEKKLTHVSYEILTDNTMPVVADENSTTNVMGNTDTDSNNTNSSEFIRPYTNSDVKIGKNYYNYKGNEKDQENSIIYYENTYIQNTGIDYVSQNEFDVISIGDGTVEKVSEDDISGKSIKIKYGNITAIYQSIKDIKVKENDTVTKGQIIAKSSTNNIEESLGNHLHLELYKDNTIINPESLYSE